MMTSLLRARFNPVALLTLALIAAAAITMVAFSGSLLPVGRNPERIWLLLLIDALLLSALIVVFARRIRKLWRGMFIGPQPSHLQKRVVMTFSLVAILPTVVVALCSVLFFNLGIQAWFNERVNTAVEESLAVAEAYANEHRENIRADALALADDINRFAGLSLANSLEFNRLVSAQSSRRSLTEVVVFQRNRIIAQGRLSFTAAFEGIPTDALERAARGETVILQPDEGEEDKVRALIRLESLPDAYLMVGRLIDSQVIGHMENTQGAVKEYRRLKEQLSRLQWVFSAVFITLALTLVLAAVWYGLVFAAQLATPIARLAAAAERVRAGDYTGRVEAGGEHDEISVLSRAFNRMVEQLESGRSALIEANRELDERRRFSEAVLSGVSAGVIALAPDRRITLSNRSAVSMLQGAGSPNLVGRAAAEVLPGIHELLVQAETSAGGAQAGMNLPGGMTLHVRVTVEPGGRNGGIEGYIVTFDDITPLVAAQRQAAWSDVARRVAHEIKNPLTPIALSAERLKRKYLKYIDAEESENFSRYVETIGRHVADIGRMVEEFVAFARMPGLVLKSADLTSIAKKSIFSEQIAHPGIRYELESPGKMEALCDERQIAQVLLNLMKNAAEAMEGAENGKISLRLQRAQDEKILLFIEDNGPGFPEGKLQSVLEPYVTTRSKGTGLGLAIAKKIMEEHGGTLQLANCPDGGARVVLSFPPHCDIKASN